MRGIGTLEVGLSFALVGGCVPSAPPIEVAPTHAAERASAPDVSSSTPIAWAPSAQPSASTGPTAPRGAPTARMLFCAYGGVGIEPSPRPPGFESVFAEMAVEIDNPGPALREVAVASARLVDERGRALATFQRVARFVVLPKLETPGPTLGIFAVYLNPEGLPFSGEVPPGTTILRARVSLDHSPMTSPTRCRLELHGGGGVVVTAEGKLDGVWPT